MRCTNTVQNKNKILFFLGFFMLKKHFKNVHFDLKLKDLTVCASCD